MAAEDIVDGNQSRILAILGQLLNYQFLTKLETFNDSNKKMVSFVANIFNNFQAILNLESAKVYIRQLF